MPSVQRAYEAFRNTNIKVLTISIDRGGARDVQLFMREHGYTVPALIDDKMEEYSRLGLTGTPGTFIVDRQGKIVAKGLGPVNFDNPELRKYVEALAGQTAGRL